MQQLGTYQTRISDYGGVNRSEGDAALGACAAVYGRVQRKLFADVAAGNSAAPLKGAYLKRYEIPARMFNAVRVSLEGKVASVQETMALRRESLQRRISRAEREITKAGRRGRRDQVHQKKRRLANLRVRLAALEGDIAEGRVRLCFGSRRLWRKQHHLEANGHASHQEWLRDWRDSRSDEFFVLGSRDETAGCQLCVATVADDGTLALRLRMPDCLAERHGKYLVIQKECGSPMATSRCWRRCRVMMSTLSADASMAKRRRVPQSWARPSTTGSSATPRDGGCSSPPI